jgi:hypothetical protein
MSTVTLRIPDEKHSRLKALARSRKVSVNKLLEEIATIALTLHDAETRFKAMAERGDPAQALRLLGKADRVGRAKKKMTLARRVKGRASVR